MTSLRAALAAVERRLAIRTRARSSAVTAVGLALPAWLIAPGGPGAGLVVVGAAIAAGWSRPVGGQAAAWMDRHGADDDLMISGAAAADGRVVTALADDVVAAADARMTKARRPSAWPVTAALAAIAAVTIAVGLAGSPVERGGDAVARDGAGRVVTAEGADDAVRGVDGAGGAAGDRGLPAGAVIVGGPRPDDRARGDGAGASIDGAGGGSDGAGSGSDGAGGGSGAGSALVEPGVDPSAAGTGAGAGDRAGTRPRPGANAGSITPATPTGVLASSAPRAGARADVIGVPARYRALVAAYLAREAAP